MNKILFLVYGILFLLTSCKEKAPYINFGSIAHIDTTYVLNAVPVTDAHNVLVEEYTGQSCSNCPSAHEALQTIANAHPNRVNIIALYQNDGSGLTKPPAGFLYDFRTDLALQMGNTIYGGVGQIPNAGIDRTVGGNGKLLIDKSYWANTVSTLLTITDSINLSLQSTFDNSTNSATIKVTVTYTRPVSTRQYLSIVVVEDSMVDKQEFPLGVTDDAYVFTNVFRAMLSSPPFGDAVLDTMAVKQAGRVYERTYTYSPQVLTPAINTRRCRVVAFVNSNNNGDYHILQSSQTKLIP